jgi:hypothetical protein
MESRLVLDFVSVKTDCLPHLLKYQDFWTISLEIKGILLYRIVAKFEISAPLGSYTA